MTESRLAERIIEAQMAGASEHPTAIVPEASASYSPPRTLGMPSASEWRAITEIALNLYKTDFVPKGLRHKKEAVLACILAGRELGLGPMQSLQGIDIIDGKPSMSAELQRALVKKAGHKIIIKESTRDRAILVGIRADTGDADEVTWTIQDAVQAGLCSLDADGNVVARSKESGKPKPWELYTRQMLVARASAELTRRHFPDVLAGITYTPDELSDGDQAADDDTGYIDAEVVEADELNEARKALREVAAANQIDSGQLKGLAHTIFGTAISGEQMTVEQLNTLRTVIETGEVPPAAPGGNAGSGDGELPSEPSTPPSPDPVLAAEIRRMGKQTWTPSAEDVNASGNPIEERQVLLDAAANVCLDMKWEDADVIKVLGGNKRNVAKALGQLDIAGLRLAVEAMEQAEQAAREGTV